jgi:putative glutamine amidotransferase
MPPRIAIPMPHSTDREYGERAIPQYERAVEQAGGVPVRIPLGQASTEAMKREALNIMESCDGVLLPGSNADVDPAKFGATRSPHTAAADPRRDAVDELLLEDAYNLRKPVLGICYGLQSLNIYRAGSLIQHIPDFLPQELRTKVNHEAGKTVAVAHSVEIDKDSRLAEILCGDSRPRLSGRAQLAGALATEDKLVVPVNSSHHQSAETIGNGLRIVARCTEDGIIEALEGTAPDHFVIAVQWHPERSVDQDEPSRAIFRALIQAATIQAAEIQAAQINAAQARPK